MKVPFIIKANITKIMKKFPELPNQPIKKAFLHCKGDIHEISCPLNLNDYPSPNEKIQVLEQIKRKIVELYTYILGDVGIVKFDYEN